jgi:hypothetical protein
VPPDEDGRPAGNQAASRQDEDRALVGASVREGRPDSAEVGPLRRLLEDAAAEERCSLGALTVLDKGNDPFRCDTPAGHRDGNWLATHLERLVGRDRKIHLRGLHYVLATDETVKPNGDSYRNTDDDWVWLQKKPADAARWLGYVPFDRITDQRNAPPTVRLWKPPEPRPYISAEVAVDIPDADELEPTVGIYWVDAEGKVRGGFGAAQPYKLVLVGEKSSLDDVLAPIAARYEADLYLPTGEMSDTLIHRIASVGKADGRSMVVFYFADCDPSGWQMGISLSRKLQAFQALGIGPDEWQVRRVALTVDQVREHGLPSAPLKETEKRADRWRQAMGVEQTEIDALAALRPDLLRRIARDALDPFFDSTLEQRSWQAYDAWQTDAQTALDNALDADRLDEIRAEAEQQLGQLREQIDAINDAMRISPGDVELPPIAPPTAELDGEGGLPPLAKSAWGYAMIAHRLIASKRYADGEP